MNKLTGILISLLISFSGAAFGDQDTEAQFIRVGGNYVVKSVEKKGDHSFIVNFAAETGSGSFDLLRLESDHVHVAVKVGRTIRLSAEILKTDGASAEISQVVLFFPNIEGHVPVWLISNKFPSRDLKASRYLDMHAPSNDYMIL